MAEGDLRMSASERDRAHVVRQVFEHRLGQREASERLGIGIRQLKRLVRLWKQQGDAGLVSGDRVNPSTGAIRNPSTLRSRERQFDGAIDRISAWQGWAETGDENAGRGGGDAGASRVGLGHAPDCGGDWV